ncbi:MAG: PKD domain-containing protein, partial [Bacteroidota bacterium]
MYFKHILRFGICLVLLGSLNLRVSAQCTAPIAVTPDSGVCGNRTFNFSVGQVTATNFNFVSTTIPVGWTSSPYVIGQPCWTYMVDSSFYFWATTRSGGVRFVQTQPLNVSAGGTIQFYMRYGADDPDPGCEDPDLTVEGVFLQYSLNGTTWVDITNWVPNPSKSGPLYSWTQYNIPIPSGAAGPNTRFRWYQPQNSGDQWDNWGVDEIFIQANIGGITSHSWNFGDSTTSTLAAPVKTYSAPGTYNVSLTITVSGGCTSTVNRIVRVMNDTIPPTARTRNIIRSVGQSGSITLTPDDVDNGSFDNCAIKTRTVSPNTFNCSQIGNHVVTLTLTDTFNNVSTATAFVTIRDSIPPVIRNKTNLVYYLDNTGNRNLLVSQIDSGTTDNCGMQSVSVIPIRVGCSDVGNKTISVVAQDIYNNTSTKNINVLVLDTVRPRARAQNRTAYLNQSGWVKITGAFLDNGSSDNCSFTLTAIPDSFTCANVGLNTVTLRALDSSGNFTTATCTVTILDTIAPVARTRNPTVYLDQFGSYTLSPSVVDSSSRDNCNITTYSVTPNAFSCSEVGPNTVTLTLTDPSSNVSSKTATVLVRDTIRPFMFAQDLTVYLDTTNKAVITPFQVDMGSYDNCSIDSMWVLPDTVDCSDLGTQTATLFARDIFNNIASVTYNLTVIDSFPPHTQARQNVLLYLDSNGLHTINPIAIDSGSTDNCGIDSFSVDPAVLDCSHLGLQRAVLTSFDFSGTNSQDSFSYTLVDTILPRIRTTDITVFLNAQGYVTVDATQVDNGSYDNCGIDWLRLSIDSFDCSHRGDNVVWLRGSDIAGNIDSTYLIVTVLDTIAPVVIPKQNLTFYLDANGFVQIGVSDVDSTSSDNCGIDSIWVTPDLVDCSQSGVNTILLYAMDEIGNTGTASVNVLVIDTIRPQVRARNLTVFLDQSGTASINTIDADSNTTDNCGVPSLALSIDQFSCSEIGSNTVYLIAVDAAGNIDSVAFNVDVLDTIIPVLNLRNIIGYLDVNGNINLDSAQLDSASYDNCGIIQFTLNPATLTCANKGDNQVEITAQDPSLNTTIGYANVHVIDTIIPIVITSNATVYLNQSGEAELTVTDVYNLSIDNCGIDSMWVLPNSFNCQSVGLQTVFLYVADSSGNVGIEAALVDVRDTIAPHTLARNAVYYLDASGFVTLSAPDLDSGSTDNCNIASLTVTPDILNCTHLGTRAVELAVYDSSNNIGRATSLITVLDTISPVTTTQDITVYLDAFGMATILPGDVNNGSTDNCGIDSMFVYPSTFNCSHIGSNTVMLTTYDESGNFSSNFANVSIVDTVSPVVDANNISVYVDANGTVSITSSDVNNTTTDNCNLDSMWVFPNSFGCTELGSNTVHLFAKDSSGNIGQIAATVDVLDTIAPVTVTRNITVYLNASGTYMILPAELDSGSTDNCAVDSMAVVPKTFGCSNLGVNTVILKTFDASGNFSSNTALVTVLDTVSPIVIARNRTVYLNASGTINVNAAQVNNGSADNCRIDSMWVLPATFGCAELGSNTVVLYAKDSTGNVNTATATVTVLDTVRPITLTRTVSAYVNALGVASITAEQVNNGSTDNCAIDSMRVFPNTFTCSTLGSNTVVLTTFDSSGNF